MMRAIIVVRAAAGLLWLSQLVLGILFWTGHALGLMQVHMVMGGLLVLALWALALLCARAGAPRALVVLSMVWTAILPVLGFAQFQLLPGPHHWIVRVVHLVVGLVAMPLAGRLSISVRPSSGTRAAPPLEFSARQHG